MHPSFALFSLLSGARLQAQQPVTSSASSAVSWTLADKWVGTDFLNGDWVFETENDPTHGRVNYVDRQTALAENLTFGTPSAGSRSAGPRVSPAPCADTRSTPTPT